MVRSLPQPGSPRNQGRFFCVPTPAKFAATLAITVLVAILNMPATKADPIDPPPPPGLVGNKYFVNITLKNGNAALGTKKLKFDTGANGTSISRADATMLGLLDANGDPVAALDSGFRPTGKNANGGTVGTTAASIPLTVSVTGKDKDGKDNGATVSPPDKKPVIYPLKASPSDISNLLGTNIIDELPKETRNPNGTLTYEAPPPKDPKKTVDMKSFEINLIDSATGQPVADPLIARPFWHILNALASSPTNTQTSDFIYDTGSPFTILSQGLTSSLGLSAIGTFDLFNSDPETFADLGFEGFIGSSDPGPLNIVELTSLLLPTESGDFLSFSNVLALVNPISSVTDNLFGTNVFDSAGLTAFEDFSAGTVQVAASEPNSISMLALSMGVVFFSRLGTRRGRRARWLPFDRPVTDRLR